MGLISKLDETDKVSSFSSHIYKNRKEKKNIF